MSLVFIRHSIVVSRRQLVFVTPKGRRPLFSWENKSDKIKEQRYIIDKTLNAEPKQIYDVVSEVSKYQDFIPYCTESFVSERDPIGGTPTKAGLRVGFQQYDEKFNCLVTCKDEANQGPNHYSVVADSISHNLFHVLYCKWTMRPHANRPHASQVELTLRFKFKSRLYNTVSSIFAKTVTELIMKAFDKRVFQVKKMESPSGLSASIKKSS
ncbi:hypothetical protein HG535_0G02780 [Zygotorulaspora mrakii]|uniref:Coenzyme Q-binding protein COQ10 START domain-containing protein n=1 Tax=Zygotorulaspora mrakii TaxID=42260 RepID=A0A7H9B6N8_ZYGMR|nr:uncharacterized protein HG535_0G02780 [Zygotorulaspora mrakii]QLG74395.1 hypothetical protein HG535_0G02780 [Zygotorulaspora mrakii]